LSDGETSDLAIRLRVSAEALSLEAERSGYVRRIPRRRASHEDYALYLRNPEPA
jgi:hypothetical protein